MSEQATLNPNTAGYYQEWSFTNSSHWGATSDDLDDTYIYVQDAAGVGKKDIQHLDDPTFNPSTINWVQVHYRAWTDGSATPERVDVIERLDANERDQGNNQTITRNLWDEYVGDQETTAPDGGEWTKSKVENLQVGVECATLGDGENLRVSKIWAVVDYIAAPVIVERNISQACGVSSSLARLLFALREIPESNNIQASVSRWGDLERTLIQACSILSSVIRFISFNRELTQAANILATINRLNKATRSLIQTLNITDSVSRVTKAIRSIVQAANIMAAVVAEKLGAIERGVSEICNIAASTTRELLLKRGVSQALSVAGVAVRTYCAVREVAQSLSISDATSRLASLIREISQSASISAFISRIAKRIRSIAQSVNMSAMVGRLVMLIRTVSQSISLLHSISRLISFTRSVSQTANIVSATSRIQMVVRTLSQSINISAALLRAKRSIRLISQSLNISEAVSKFLSLIRTISQPIAINTVATRSLSLQRRILELSNITDLTISQKVTMQFLYVILKLWPKSIVLEIKGEKES